MLKVLELFSGYGSQALALENLDIEFTSDISEIDKHAIDAYNQIHGNTKNYGDICNINEAELPEYDLITYSSPCQDFSLAGKMQGGEKGSGTRSSLLWECERIIRAVKPKYLLMENVKNLVGKKFKPCFDAWLQTLDELGYNNYWKVLNAKDYGIPQNRERVFVVSIRKDLNQTYMFPEPVPLTLKLKDLLESEVDEKYYLPQEKVEQLALNGGSLDGKHTWDVVSVLRPERTEYGKAIRKEYESGNIQESRHNMTELQPRTDGVSNTLTTVQKDNLVMYVGNALYPDKNYTGHNYAGATFDAEGLAPTLNTMNGGNREPYIMQRSHGFNEGGLKENCPTITSQGSWNQNNFIVEQKPYIVSDYGKNLNKETEVSHCLQARDYKGFEHQAMTGIIEIGVGHNPISKKFEFDGIRIRKLTPRECWRLMGVRDEQFDRLHGISKTQLYKMAGNSIVVDVLMAIFKNLLISDKETKGQLSLF